MGEVIRPAIFAARNDTPAIAGRRRRLRVADGRLVAYIVAAVGLAGILILAGAAFTFRALVVLCFAALAGQRTRRIRSALGA